MTGYPPEVCNGEMALAGDCCLRNCKEYSSAAVTQQWQWLSRQEMTPGTQLLQFIFVSQITLEC